MYFGPPLVLSQHLLYLSVYVICIRTRFSHGSDVSSLHVCYLYHIPSPLRRDEKLAPETE